MSSRGCRPSRPGPRCGLLRGDELKVDRLMLTLTKASAGCAAAAALPPRAVGHRKQMPEDLEFVALGQFDQIGNGLRDEGHGLIRAALPIGLLRSRSAIPARSAALPAAPSLAQKNDIQCGIICPTNTRFMSATLGRISQLFRYKVVPPWGSINICRFVRAGILFSCKFNAPPFICSRLVAGFCIPI